MIMPDEQAARNIGTFHGVTPPYVWEIREDEVFLLLDALEALMQKFQERLQEKVNDEQLEALSGSFVYAKMTRQKLLGLVPDIREQIES
jgi:hypothetical protein